MSTPDGARTKLLARRVLAVSVALTIASLGAPSKAATKAAVWHMDDKSEMTDDSGNGNDGTPTDVTLVTPGFDGQSGAYSFNGSSSIVTVPDSTSLNPGSSDVSITVHVNFSVAPDDTVGDYDLVRKKQEALQYKIEIVSAARAYCVFGGTQARAAISIRKSLADGNWHTITCSKTSDAITLVVDGRTKSKTVTIGSISNTAGVVLGGKEAQRAAGTPA